MTGKAVLHHDGGINREKLRCTACNHFFFPSLFFSPQPRRLFLGCGVPDPMPLTNLIQERI